MNDICRGFPLNATIRKEMQESPPDTRIALLLIPSGMLNMMKGASSGVNEINLRKFTGKT